MSRPFLAAPIAVVLFAACGASGDNVAVLDSGTPSARLDPSPAFSEGELTVTTAPATATPAAGAPISEAPTDEAPAISTAQAADNDLAELTAPATSPAPEATAPPSTFVPPEPDAATYDLPGCPETPRGAVADKEAQRYWLCADGRAITDEIPMTTASGNYGLPPVGTYPVFARDEDAFGIGGEALERFVAFYTTPRGNRIAFHEVVNQDPATVGDLDQRGESAGCFRVREDDSVQVWDFLQIDDPVVIIT